MGSIAMTRMQDGITKQIAVPLTQIAFDDVFFSDRGLGMVLEGNGQGCAVRIGFSDAEGRDLASRLNAHFARAGRTQRETAKAAVAVPPATTGDVA